MFNESYQSWPFCLLLGADVFAKFSNNFYDRVQNSFMKIANRSKKKYHIFDNSNDDKDLEKVIFNVVINKLKRWKIN